MTAFWGVKAGIICPAREGAMGSPSIDCTCSTSSIPRLIPSRVSRVSRISLSES